MLNVIDYIIKNSLETLVATYSLKMRRHILYPNLVQLMYDQLETPKNDITNNCRGLIIDTNTMKVVSFPFTRFSDYNPMGKQTFDFDDCTYWKKLDGSLMTLYWYDGKWNVASKGMPDASGQIKGLDITMNDYFWKVWKLKKYELPKFTDHCYMFEMERPSEDFLVKVSEPNITLIGVRNLKTFKEVSIERAKRELCISWECATGKKSTLNDILLELNEVDPIKMEGYVACDSNFNRLKIKSPQYDNINLLRTSKFISNEEYIKRKSQIDKDNFRRMCEIVRTNSHKSFLSLDKYKEHTVLHSTIKTAYKRLQQKLDTLIEYTKTLTGKELGLKMKDNQNLSGIVFAYQKGAITDIPAYLRKLEIRKFESLIRGLIK